MPVVSTSRDCSKHTLQTPCSRGVDEAHCMAICIRRNANGTMAKIRVRFRVRNRVRVRVRVRVRDRVRFCSSAVLAVLALF